MQKERYIFKVSELNLLIRNLLEREFSDIWLEGEISNFRPNISGHWYFTLKDESGQINAVVFRNVTVSIKFKLEDGLKVIVRGRVSVFTQRGQYQIVINEIEPAGKGALQLAFEQLKEKLRKEGLFAPEHKKPIPLLPQKIGIVTSPTGAAIRDILNILGRRFTNLEILIYPVLVQGEGAKEEIAQAIYDLNRYFSYLDVLLVARGGGSLEDLWAFNEEIVARAVYDSKIPIISAVGHEIDFTICDFVADLRAPTPSAAAELVVKEKEALVEQVKNAQRKITTYVAHILENYRLRLDHMLSSPVLTRPLERLHQMQQEIDDLLERIAINSKHVFEIYRNKFSQMENLLIIKFEHYFKEYKSNFNYLIGQLQALSPLAILERGYSITYKLPENKIITESNQAKVNDEIKVKLFKGELKAKVEETQESS